MEFHRWLLALAGGAILALTGCTTGSDAANGAVDHVATSASCDTCHAKDVASWKDSYHARMVRPAAEALLPEAVAHWALDAKGNAGPSTGNIDGQRYGLIDVEMVVGSKWKQRYLVKNPLTGNHQFLDKQWNSYTRLWEAYGQKDDWETLCTTCHVGGERAEATQGVQANAGPGG